jgi:pimeloyl-ACP methyl ester carboxylesterase
MAGAEEVGRIRVEAVDVGGRTLAYRRAGEGPPPPLLHGAWGDSRDWRLQVEGPAGYADAVAAPAAECNGEVRRRLRSVAP